MRIESCRPISKVCSASPLPSHVSLLSPRPIQHKHVFFGALHAHTRAHVHTYTHTHTHTHTHTQVLSLSLSLSLSRSFLRLLPLSSSLSAHSPAHMTLAHLHLYKRTAAQVISHRRSLARSAEDHRPQHGQCHHAIRRVFAEVTMIRPWGSRSAVYIAPLS